MYKFTHLVHLVCSYGAFDFLWRCIGLSSVSQHSANRRIGALFGPAMTKWYELLNRLHFPSPTKALIYRVRRLYVFVALYISSLIYLSNHGLQVWLDQAILTPGRSSSSFSIASMLNTVSHQWPLPFSSVQ